MFEGWDSFYLLTGGAGGGLIGLLFVVATLGRRGDTGEMMRAVEAYMTPIVFHLGLVLATSAAVTAPGLAPRAQAGLVAFAAFLGLASSIRIILRLNGPVKPAHWSDVWCYGAAPLAAYLVLAAGAAAVLVAPGWAPRLVATALLVQLILAIRNAWDLVTWMSVKLHAEPPES